MSVVLAKNCIEKSKEWNISESFFKGKFLSRAMSVIIVPIELIALISKVARLIFIDSVGRFCLVTLQYCDSKKDRFRKLDVMLNPKATAKKIAALSIGVCSSLLFSWSLPGENHAIHENLGLSRKNQLKIVIDRCDPATPVSPLKIVGRPAVSCSTPQIAQAVEKEAVESPLMAVSPLLSPSPDVSPESLVRRIDVVPHVAFGVPPALAAAQQKPAINDDEADYDVVKPGGVSTDA